MAQIIFDPSKVTPNFSNQVAPMPPGIYQTQIVKAALEPNKARDGMNLTITHQIVNSVYAGRQITDILVVHSEDPNKQRGVELGRGKLAAYCQILGIKLLNDTDELIGGVLQVDVIIEKDPSGRFPDKNRIKEYKKINFPSPPSSIAPSVETTPSPMPTPAPVAPAPTQVSASTTPQSFPSGMPDIPF